MNLLTSTKGNYVRFGNTKVMNLLGFIWGKKNFEFLHISMNNASISAYCCVNLIQIFCRFL